MKNKTIIPAILFIAVLIFAFFALSQKKEESQAQVKEPISQENQQSSQIILFYGDSCPHCALVEDYIKENGIGDKISFSQKEVYHNQNNAKELEEKAKICGMPTDSIGVPFLWDGSKCLVGDQDIIDFFKSKINAQ